MKTVLYKTLCLSLLVLGLHAANTCYVKVKINEIKPGITLNQLLVDATAPIVRKSMKATNQKDPNIKGIKVPVDQVAKYAAILALQAMQEKSKGELADSIAHQAAEDVTYYGLNKVLKMAKAHKVPGVKWIEENVLKPETVSAYAVRCLLRLMIRETVTDIRKKVIS